MGVLHLQMKGQHSGLHMLLWMCKLKGCSRDKITDVVFCSFCSSFWGGGGEDQYVKRLYGVR